MKIGSHAGQSRGTARRQGILAATAVLACLAMADAAPALAQDEAARIAEGEQIWRQAGCGGCHGADARGGAGGEQPAGPSLRSSSLDSELFAETVACGRPGTPMPANLAGAYTEVSCYGIPAGEPMEGVMRAANLTQDQIAMLVEYIMSLN